MAYPTFDMCSVSIIKYFLQITLEMEKCLNIWESQTFFANSQENLARTMLFSCHF